MSVLLRVLPLVAAVAGLLLPAGAQVPVKGGEVSDFDFAVGGLPERRRANPGPGAGVEQPAGNDTCIPERLGECTHDGRRCVECRQRRIAHALHEVFIPLFAAGIMAQQFVQFPHLWEEFPVGLSLREIVVRSGRL